MKTLSRIFLTAILFAITLVSCGKITPTGGGTPGGDIPGGNTEQEAGTRIVTVSFGTKATRTTFDGKDYVAPHFEVNDVIRVWKSDGSDFQNLLVQQKDNQDIYYIELPEDYSGELLAVYPEKYATEDSTNPFYVPYHQTGKYADANICTATIPGVKNPTAEFKNETAVFAIEVPEETTLITVTSLNWINDSTGQRYEDDEEGTNYGSYIVYDNEDSEYYHTIQIWPDDEEDYLEFPDNICFISVLADDVVEGKNTVPKVLLRDLNFDVCVTLDYTEGIMGGFSPKFLGNKYNDAVQAGAMYTGVEDHLHEYISNPHSFEDGLYTFIWAKKDLNTSGGNTTDFFMWGELSGHSYVEAENEEPAYWTYLPGGFIEGYIPDVVKNYESGDVLQLEDDAAYYNWGGAWRMPKFEEMKTWSGGADTNAFPMTLSKYRYVQGNNEPTQGTEYYYWTSEKGRAFYYNYNNENFVKVPNEPVEKSCFYGMLIRPMSGIIEEIIEEYESD